MPDAPVAPNPVLPDRPPADRAEPTRRLRTVRVTAVVAFVGVLLALLGLGLSARPLATPTQDCGTAFTFLVTGQLDQFVDPANPPEGVTEAEAEANNAEPCQERAAARAVPAGALVIGGTLLGLAALLAESTVRFVAARRADARALSD